MKTIDCAWDFEVASPGRKDKSVVTLKSEGNNLTGTMNSEEYGVQDIEDGAWELVEVSDPFHSMPKGEPEVEHRIWLYRVLSDV